MWEICSHQQSPQVANWNPHCQRKAALAGAQCELGDPQIKQKPLPPMPLERPSFVLWVTPKWVHRKPSHWFLYSNLGVGTTSGKYCHLHQHSWWWEGRLFRSQNRWAVSKKERRWQEQPLSIWKTTDGQAGRPLWIRSCRLSAAPAARARAHLAALRLGCCCPRPGSAPHLQPCTLCHLPKSHTEAALCWGIRGALHFRERKIIESTWFYPISTPRWGLGSESVMLFLILNKTGF